MLFAINLFSICYTIFIIFEAAINEIYSELKPLHLTGK